MVPKTIKRPEECDLILQLFTFNVRSKSQKKFIDRASWDKNVTNNPKFYEQRDSGQLLGCLTHDSRDVLEKQNRKIPYLDNISLSPTLCNITRDVWTDKKDRNRVLCSMDLLDTDAGKRVRELIKAGSNISCSMSTKATQDGEKYYIQELLGVDLTYRNDLDSTIIKVNFSEDENADDSQFSLSQPDPEGHPDVINFNFCARVLSPDEVTKLEFEDANFSDNSGSDDNTTDTEENVIASEANTDDFIDEEDYSWDVPDEELDSLEAFSLKEFLRESDFPPYISLNRRVNEVIRTAKQLKPAKFEEKKAVLRNYIEQFVNNYVVASMNTPNSKFNIMLGLRLGQYCKDRQPAIKLQRSLTRYKQQIKSQGYVNKAVAKEVNENNRAVLQEIFNYINDRIGSKASKVKLDKKGNVINNTNAKEDKKNSGKKL